MKTNVVFYSPDSKTGCTMISQSVAEKIADNFRDLEILYLNCSYRTGNAYMKDLPKDLNQFKLHLDHKTLRGDEIKQQCQRSRNLYFFGGVQNPEYDSGYYPEMIHYLFEEVEPLFDLVICDGGNLLHDGLTLGALQRADIMYCILAQSEISITALEKECSRYGKLQISFDQYIINRYSEQNTYDLKYIAMRLKIPEERLYKIMQCTGGYSAEMQRKTLLSSSKNRVYEADITAVVNSILERIGLPRISKKGRFYEKILFG